MVDWDYFDRFEPVNDRWLPFQGEGNCKATQIVTAVTKLVYKWYNDGDVYDNTYHLEGWANDLSSYANWLVKYTSAGNILYGISTCLDDGDYEELLKKLADTLLVTEDLEKAEKEPAIDSIYTCEGIFKFVEAQEDDYDEWEDDEEDEYYDDEEEEEW